MLVRPELLIARLGVPEGSLVADFGAGTGHWAVVLAKRVGPKGKVYAIDVQQELLSNVLASGKETGVSNIEVIWGDLDKTGGSKLADASVDFVVLANTLFQLEDKKAVAGEIKRVLKPGGKLLVVDWKDSLKQFGPHKTMIVGKAEGEKIFKDAGFEEDQSFDAGEHQWGAVFKKNV
ncbi:MAG TPA: methyltransferase domain-containing protein [Candidatus Paceibacterota bacterium]